jgi:hypothetical protein
MAEPMSEMSPDKLNSTSVPTQETDMSWHNPPSSPFVSHVEHDQENIAPPDAAISTPIKQHIDIYEPQSTFKITPPLKSQESLRQRSPSKTLLDDFDEPGFARPLNARRSPKKTSPVEEMAVERPESSVSDSSHMDFSPAKSHIVPSEPAESVIHFKHSSFSQAHKDPS